MVLVFYLTFNVIGAWLQGLLEIAIDHLTILVAMAMKAGDVNLAMQSLVLNGIFKGVGSVLSFLPIIVTLFFFLSLMEDSGYIARVAFVMDKLLRKIGLSGRSIVPMLIGFGCTVPAVMANPYPDQRARPQNDDPSDTFYELYGKIANLCFLCQCLLSETGLA